MQFPEDKPIKHCAARSVSASGERVAGSSGAALTLGMSVLERGWLSANQVVFRSWDDLPATVVDTGFARHAQQTLALVDHALAGEALGRIVNTHLHSDHCGGNRALQDRAGVETWVPQGSLARVRCWDEPALSYQRTGQPCPRFAADHGLMSGATIALGAGEWQIHAAPGHDHDAVLLFEPQTRTLIAGDALWERELAIIFPELTGDPGFAAARATLDLIEQLDPREVIPGHGAPFGDVEAALASSRERLAEFETAPERHIRHAARALLMFHLLDVGHSHSDDLVDWMLKTPIYRAMLRRAGSSEDDASNWALGHIGRLVDTGRVMHRDGSICIAPQAQAALR